MSNLEDDWPDPTPEMIESPEFNAVWNLLKEWKVVASNGDDKDTCDTPTGRHVRAIIDAIRSSRPKTALAIVEVLQKGEVGGKSRSDLINKLHDMLKGTVT